MKQIKVLGFNTVRTWVECAHCEPEEGVYRLKAGESVAGSQPGLRLVAEAEELGLDA